MPAFTIHNKYGSLPYHGSKAKAVATAKRRAKRQGETTYVRDGFKTVAVCHVALPGDKPSCHGTPVGCSANPTSP